MAAEEMVLEAVMEFERETKRTYRYRELSYHKSGAAEPEAVAIGTLYIKKGVLGATPPGLLKVTVSQIPEA